MKTTTDNIDEYLARLPESVRSDMTTLDKAITKTMSNTSRTLWRGVFWGGTEQAIIGYGDLVYERPSGTVEWFMVGLALQKNYISVYINAVEDGKYVVETHKEALGKVKVGKSSVSFSSLDDVNLEALLQLITLAHKQLSSQSR
jgi:hypothetical protein